MTSQLSTTESAELQQCERTIALGLRTFNDVGHALMTVRDGRLYRAQYQTFEAYCVQRWNFTGSRARQLVAAAEVVDVAGSVTTVTVSNEGQARELVTLKEQPEELRAVLEAQGGADGSGYLQREGGPLRQAPGVARPGAGRGDADGGRRHPRDDR